MVNPLHLLRGTTGAAAIPEFRVLLLFPKAPQRISGMRLVSAPRG